MLGETAALLRGRGVRFAVVGAAAMAVHGVTRSTRDLDLLTTSAECLSAEFWDPLRAAGVDARVARGDQDDPLAGVARLRRGDESPVDVVVGRHAWQNRVLEHARDATIEGDTVRVASVADVILLKLFAGGPQDAWDVTQMLADPDRDVLIADVESSLGELPEDCRRLWRRIRDER